MPDELIAIDSQSRYNEWLRTISEQLNHAWQADMGKAMQYGGCRKLTNLLLKQLMWWTRLDEKRQQLIGYLHVPLEKFTLVGMRYCVEHLRIPKTATMGFVTDEAIYNDIQSAIRRIAAKANVPPIYFDVLAWNAQHRDS